MSTYVRQSSCSTFNIPSENGDIKVHGGPFNPSVLFPVSDQTLINQFCEKNKNTKTPTEIRNCENDLRNQNTVNFVISQSQLFKPPFTEILIQNLGMCQSQGLKEHVQSRQQTSTNEKEKKILSFISDVCQL